MAADLPTFPRGRPPSAVYEYQALDGPTVLVVARWEATATEKKRFAQYTRDPKTKAWRNKGFPRGELKPLFDLPMLMFHPDAPVLVVEGEKKCLAAAQYLPPGWMVTCWAGGGNAAKQTDWVPLKTRRVVVWPDNDGPGTAAANLVGKQLEGVAIVDLPPGLPDGWDLGDELPPTLTVDAVRDLILSAKVPTHSPSPVPIFDDTPLPYLNGHTVAIAKYRALGYKDGRFYFFSSRTHNVHEFNSRDLRSGNGLRDLEPDDLYWARQPRRAASGDNGAPLDWKYLGDLAIAECYRFGVYNEEKRRARGVWLDASLPHSSDQPTPIVAHLGDSVSVDGTPTPIMTIESRYIYPVDEPLLPDAPPDVPPLTDDEGSDLRYLCRYLPWVNNTSGDLLAGLIASSVICGAMKFRTHGWITGPSGAGKSFIMENIIARALEGTALHILSNSSEPGIRRHLSHDARPAIYDEAEGEGPAGKQRRDMIIALMRASSTETKAKILLGSGGKRGESFPVRAQFILGSVGTALDRATDQTRCLLLTLRSNQPTSESHRRDLNVKFTEIQEKIAALPAHLSVRLFRRMSSLVHTVRSNAELFRRMIAAKYATSRVGDQLGTVLAGVYALEHSTACDEKTAAAFLDAFPWAEYITSQDSHGGADEGDLLNHLCSHHLRTEAGSGTITRTVGELCAIVSDEILSDEGDGIVSRSTARRTLDRHGIAYGPVEQGAPQMFWIANNHPEVRKIFATSQFPQGYQPILLRIIGARKSPRPRTFAGASARAILLPREKLVHV